MKNIKNWTKWVYWFLFAVAVIAVYKTLDNFTNISIWLENLVSVLMPFIIGIIIAYLLYIPCKNIEKLFSKCKILKKRARGLSVLSVYIIVILIIIFIVNILIPAISESVVDLAEQLPVYYQKAINFVDNMPEDWIISKESVQNAIYELQRFDITKILNMETITDYIEKVMGIASAIFGVFVTVAMSVYILLEREEILAFFNKIIRAMYKEEKREKIQQYFAKTNSIFFRFISSQLLDAVIMGIIASIAMWILGVKYAALLGFMIGLFNIIPYFGAIVAVIIATVITIFTGGIGQAIWLVVIVTILQQIDANVINPRIVGNALTLSPILVIFSVTIGGAYFGVLGMFLAVPVIAVIKILVNDYLESKIKEKEENIEEM